MLMKPNQYDADNHRVKSADTTDRLGLVGRIVEKVEAYITLRKERRELLQLDDRLLNDIGLNRGEAQRLASERFDWIGKSHR